ncbi:hypothetical protein B0F90DRAFT_1813737 [Multifurca ochricompacta]|uniref:DRBM domain-containing protein n=1 Tax=Multifurca ochricompacta TaxID=376703 RepID=A0AAD4MCW4_9AGAM|nr:hypothetical protein B0F90DRAFT_1813737 [Multifurca ochricompacta]
MADPVRDLNNYLQEVQQPNNLAPLLPLQPSKRGRITRQSMKSPIFVLRNVVVGKGNGTAIGLAKRAAATQALRYFYANGIPSE